MVLLWNGITFSGKEIEIVDLSVWRIFNTIFLFTFSYIHRVENVLWLAKTLTSSLLADMSVLWSPDSNKWFLATCLDVVKCSSVLLKKHIQRVMQLCMWAHFSHILKILYDNFDNSKHECG